MNDQIIKILTCFTTKGRSWVNYLAHIVILDSVGRRILWIPNMPWFLLLAMFFIYFPSNNNCTVKFFCLKSMCIFNKVEENQ